MARKKTSQKPKRTRSAYVPHIEEDRAPPCEVEGCREPGAYKAPKSKKELHDYRWLCLDHIREHNQRWDYFSDMDRDAIEDFMKDATYGHRPTWDRESRLRQRPQMLQDALYEFLHMGGRKAPPAAPPLPARVRKAVAILDIEYPCTAKELKSQYRALVKKHHPDVNKGNKQSEERFKQITAAYTVLAEHIKNL